MSFVVEEYPAQWVCDELKLLQLDVHDYVFYEFQGIM